MKRPLLSGHTVPLAVKDQDVAMPSQLSEDSDNSNIKENHQKRLESPEKWLEQRKRWPHEHPLALHCDFTLRAQG